MLLGVQTAAPQFAIGRHKAQKSQEIPYITKKDERDNSEAKRKCDLGTSGIINPEEGDSQLGACDEEYWWIVFVDSDMLLFSSYI